MVPVGDNTVGVDVGIADKPSLPVRASSMEPFVEE